MVKHNEITIKRQTQHWNEAFDIAKDENVWKTLIKDCPIQQML